MGLVAAVLALVAWRLIGKSGIERIDTMASREVDTPIRFTGLSVAVQGAYLEVLNLAELDLERGEMVLAAAGARGETEKVLMATNRRAFVFSRRYGTSNYQNEVFDYGNLRPIPISQAVIGETIRLLAGDRIAEIKSPGAESWMDSAEDVVKAVNRQIRDAHIEEAKKK